MFHVSLNRYRIAGIPSRLSWQWRIKCGVISRTFGSSGHSIYLVVQYTLCTFVLCHLIFICSHTHAHTHHIAHVQPVSGSILLLVLLVRFTVSQSALFAFAACAPSIDLYQYPSTISLCNIPVEPIGSSNKNCIKNDLNLFALIKITPTHTCTRTYTHTHIPTPTPTPFYTHSHSTSGDKLHLW